MSFLINSTLALDIIAMAASLGLVIWSLQIKNGSSLAMIGGVILFILSILSITYTGFYGGKLLMKGDADSQMVIEHTHR